MEYLQSVLKEFNNAAAFIDDFLIWYFRDGIRSSICAKIDKRDHNLDNWQVIVEQIVNSEAKTARQTLLLVQSSDACYVHGHKPLYNEEKNQKDSEIKKLNPTTNNNSRDRKGGRSSQVLDQSSKKTSHLNKNNYQNQSSNNTPTIGINTTIVKKDKK